VSEPPGERGADDDEPSRSFRCDAAFYVSAMSANIMGVSENECTSVVALDFSLSK
jgi:hypothetical protein